MVKQLEVSLYRSASSFEAYSDTSTLKHRLLLLAMEIARKTQQHKQQDDGRNTRGMGSPERGSIGGYNSSRRGDNRHPMNRSGGRHDRNRMDDSYHHIDINSSSSSGAGLDPILSSILECLGDSLDAGQRPPPPCYPRYSKQDPSRDP